MQQSKGVNRRIEQALAFGLGLAWIGWHVARYGVRKAAETVADEAEHASAAIRGRLEQLRGSP